MMVHSLASLKKAMLRCLAVCALSSGLLASEANALCIRMPIEGWWRFDSGDEHIRLYFELACKDTAHRVCDDNGNCHMVPQPDDRGYGRLIMQSRFNNYNLKDLGRATYNDAYDGTQGSYSATFMGDGYTLSPRITYDNAQGRDQLHVEITVGSPYGASAYGTYTLQRSAVSFEPNTDRCGSDYKNIEMNAFSPYFCEAACILDKSCRAFTIVPPGVQGPKAHCYLKNAVPGPRPAPGMISGAKQS